MALQMAAAEVSHAAGVSVTAATSAMPADCPMMAMLLDKSDAPQGTAAKMNGVCHACYLCMAIATPESQIALHIPQLLQSPQMLPMSDFANAVLASDIKPPISHS